MSDLSASNSLREKFSNESGDSWNSKGLHNLVKPGRGDLRDRIGTAVRNGTGGESSHNRNEYVIWLENREEPLENVRKSSGYRAVLAACAGSDIDMKVELKPYPSRREWQNMQGALVITMNQPFSASPDAHILQETPPLPPARASIPVEQKEDSPSGKYLRDRAVGDLMGEILDAENDPQSLARTNGEIRIPIIDPREDAASLRDSLGYRSVLLLCSNNVIDKKVEIADRPMSPGSLSMGKTVIISINKPFSESPDAALAKEPLPFPEEKKGDYSRPSPAYR